MGYAQRSRNRKSIHLRSADQYRISAQVESPKDISPTASAAI